MGLKAKCLFGIFQKKKKTIFDFQDTDVMQLDQIYSAFTNTSLRECFGSVYHEATKDNHDILYIDVVMKELWKQFCKELNDF